MLNICPELFPQSFLNEFRLRFVLDIFKNCVRFRFRFFPPFFHELYFDSEGNPLDEDLSHLCELIYEKATGDINLGGSRRGKLLEYFGKSNWANLCEDAASRARAKAISHQDVDEAKQNAKKSLEGFFSREIQRTKLQRDSEYFLEDLVASQLQELEEMRDALLDACLEPQIEIEIIGAYVLSKEPFWQEE